MRNIRHVASLFHSPAARRSFLAASASFAFRGLLWKEFGGGVGWNSRPQPKDTFPLLDLFSAEKPEQTVRHYSPVLYVKPIEITHSVME